MESLLLALPNESRLSKKNAKSLMLEWYVNVCVHVFMPLCSGVCVYTCVLS